MRRGDHETGRGDFETGGLDRKGAIQRSELDRLKRRIAELEMGFPDSSENVLSSFKNLLGSSENLLGSFKNLLGSSNEVSGSTEELLGSAVELSGSSEELLGSSNEVSGSSREHGKRGLEPKHGQAHGMPCSSPNGNRHPKSARAGRRVVAPKGPSHAACGGRPFPVPFSREGRRAVGLPGRCVSSEIRDRRLVFARLLILPTNYKAVMVKPLRGVGLERSQVWWPHLGGGGAAGRVSEG
jgi:hypothetical protein